MKRFLREACIIAVFSIVGYVAIMGVLAYMDWKGCVCSLLTETEQTYPIDDKFYRICEQDTLRSGTFAIIRTQCDHGKYIHLTVYPDNSTYKGYIKSQN